MSKLTSCMLTFLDLNEINVDKIPPANPVNNQLWLCTEAYKDPNNGIEYASNTLYKWNAVAGRWEVTNDYDGDIQDILDKINQSQSRNLLLDTAKSLDVESDGTTFSYGAKYFLIPSIKFNDHLKNNTVTLAFDWEYIGSSPSGTLQAKTDGITPILLSDVITVSNSNYYGTSVFSYAFDEDSNKMFNAVGFNVRTNGKIRITHPRLFYGSIDYGWVQAPEDLINQFKTLFERTDKGVYIEASSTLGGKSIVDINNKAIKIASSNIVLEGYTTINQHFKVLPNGDVEAVNAKFSGDVDAFSITGATITGSKITTGENFVVGTDGILHAKHADIQGDITAGSTITGATYTSTNGKFKVLENGTMECEDANIKGSITAGSTITGAEIIGSTIRNENSTFMVKTDGTIIGANIKGGTIGIGNGTNYDAFTVDKNGNVNISKGTINIANKFVVNATGKVTANDINVTGGEINMNNGVFKVTNDGTAVAQNIKITGGSLTIGSNFSVDNTGVLTATNGNFTGEIKAGSNISGASFTSNNGTLKIDASGNITSKGNVSFANGNFTCDNAGNVNLKGSLTAGTTITGASISGGSISIGNDKFTVDKNGVLTAKGATITGNITMTGGSVPDNVLSDTIKKGAANGTSALKQITNLKIGGRNLLLNTKNFDKNWSNGSVVNGTQGYKAYKLERINYTGSDRKIAQQNINRIYSKFIKGTSITISGWIYIDSSVNIANDSNNIFVRLYNSSSGYKDYCQIQLNSLNKDTWIRFEKSEVIQADAISNDGNMFAVAIKQNGLFKLSMPKLEIGNKASDYTEAPEDTETLIDDALQAMENDLQNQIDGKIETFNQTSDPSSSWTTDAVKKQHTGDIWYNGSYTYRWSGTAWVKLTDKDATNANALASKKAQVFTSQPKVPYYVGDLWITNLSGSGVVKTCKTSRTNGSYTASDWVEGLKYIDTSKAQSLVDTGVKNITIGGRNLAIGTSSSYSTAYTKFSGTTNNCITLNKVLVDGLSVGNVVSVRLVIKYTNIVATSGQTAKCWIQGSGDVTAWNSGAFNSSPQFTISGSGEHEFTYQFTINADHLKNKYWSTDLRTDYIASGSIQYKMFKVEKATKVSDWSPAPEDTGTLIDDALQDMANDLQTQIDGKIQTYNQTSDPASNWTSTEKTLHTGDIWYNGSYTYRYSGSEWVKLTDKDATNANSLASKKAQVFTAQPTIPYYKGDLWVTSLNKTGVVKTCKTTRTSGSYTASDWVEGLKYIDETKAQSLVDTGIKNISIGGRNLIVHKDEYLNTYLDTSGNKVSNNTTNTMKDFIKVVPNEELTFRKETSNEYFRWNWHTSTKTYISRNANNSNSFTWKVPENAYYIWVSYPNTGNVKVERGNIATDWTPAPEDTETLIDDAIQDMANDLQTQIDGKIQTYYQSTDPSTNWTTTTLKTQHTGDIWQNSSTNKTYRWSGTAWQELKNQEAVNANSLASKKAQVFTATPTIPYYKGDLWITNLSGTGVVKTCQTTRTSGSYTASDWVEGLKYTDDTAINNLSIGGRNLLVKTSTSNTKTFDTSISTNNFQTDDPYTTFNKKPLSDFGIKVGDKITLSFDWEISNATTYGNFRAELMNNSTYISGIGNIYTFSSTNTSGRFVATLTIESKHLVGNTLRIRVDNSKLTMKISRVKLEKSNKASDWSPAPEDTDQAIIDKINAQTQEFIFNKLTNNGALEGLFMKDNKLYINGSYIQAGTVKGNFIDAKNLNVANKFSIDANGNVLIGANKTGAHIYWDGSKLEIIANSMKIGSTNVATISDVDGIQIGGRNLVKQSKLLTDLTKGAWTVENAGSEGFKKIHINSTNTNWDECYIPIYPAINTLTNKLTISFEYKQSTSGLLVFNFGVFNNNSRLKELTNWVVDTTFTKHSTRDGWNYVSYTFDPTSINGVTNANNYKIEFKKANGKTGEIQVKKPMLEIGTKPSDWYPAPEDFDKAMSDKINAQTQEFIFNKLTNNGTEQGIYLNNKKIYINGSYIQAGTVKGNYIDAKNLNVANKFSIDANGNVLIGANRTGSHIYWNGTNLEVQATSIKLGTANVATITDVNSVTTRVTKLEGAGTSNMIKNSDFRNGSLHWSYNKDTDWIDSNYLTPYGNTSYTINQSGHTSNSWNGINQTISGLQNGIQYTFGCYYKAHSNYFSDDGSQIGFEIKGPKTDGSGDAVVHGATLNYSDITFNTWKWVQFSFSIPSNVDASRCYLFCWIKKNGRLTLGDFMLSKGSTITTWSLSPYDNSDYAESKITQTANSIRSEVSDGYATKSEVTQTANSLTLEFKTHSSFPNLVLNGAPSSKHLNHWWVSNSGDGGIAHIYYNDTTYLSFYSQNAYEVFCWHEAFGVKSSTGYSISFWLKCQSNVNSYDVYVVEYDSSGNATYRQIVGAQYNTNWVRYKINHVTLGTTVNMAFRFDHNGLKDASNTSNVNVTISEVMVIEGWDYFPDKWYPAPEEIYSNAVTFNKFGMEIRQNNGAYGRYDASGLRFYNTSGIKYSEISNGAFHCIDDAGYLKGYLGRSVWGNSSNYMTSVNATYTNTVVLGIQETSNGGNLSYVTCSHNDQAVGRWLDGHYQWNGVNINRNLTLNQGLIRITRNTAFDDNYPHVIGNSGDGYLSINGDNGVYLGILSGDKAYAGVQITETGTAGDNYNVVNFRCPVRMNGWSIKNIDAATDDLQPQSLAMVSALNNDSDIHNTNNTDYQIYRTDSFTVGTIKYTDRKTYKTSEEIHYNFSPPLKTGKYTCYVELPWLLAENIEQDIHISISKLSWGDYRIIDKCPYYFILESENDNFNFTYEVTAKLLEKSNGNNIVVANEQYYKYSIEGSEDKEGLVIHEGEELTKAQILSNKKQSN